MKQIALEKRHKTFPTMSVWFGHLKNWIKFWFIDIFPYIYTYWAILLGICDLPFRNFIPSTCGTSNWTDFDHDDHLIAFCQWFFLPGHDWLLRRETFFKCWAGLTSPSKWLFFGNPPSKYITLTSGDLVTWRLVKNYRDHSCIILILE